MIEPTIVGFEVDLGRDTFLLFCRWDGRLLWPAMASGKQAVHARRLKVRRINQAAIDFTNSVIADFVIDDDPPRLPGPWRGPLAPREMRYFRPESETADEAVARFVETIKGNLVDRVALKYGVSARQVDRIRKGLAHGNH